MYRLVIIPIVLVSFSAHAKRSKNCGGMPDSMFVDYWQRRDILRTTTRAERMKMMPERKIRHYYRGDRFKGATKASYRDYRRRILTENIVSMRQKAFERKLRRSPAKWRRYKRCTAEVKRHNAALRAEDKRRRAARRAKQASDFWAAKARVSDGRKVCYAGDCRICSNGTCSAAAYKAAKAAPCAKSDQSTRCRAQRSQAFRVAYEASGWKSKCKADELEHQCRYRTKREFRKAYRNR